MRKPALALLALSGLAAAQSSVDAYLAMLDVNGDARVDLAEYLDYMGAGFDRLDVNGDGMLDATELPPGPRRQPALTRAQHRQNLTATFRRQDVDGNGYLDARELAAPPR